MPILGYTSQRAELSPLWFEPSHVETVRDAFPEWMALLFAFLSHLGSVWFVAPAVVLTVRTRVATRDDLSATVILFATAAVLSVFALAVSDKPDVAALRGGSLGAALSWRYATPAREPWPANRLGVARALLGLAALATVALVLLVVETTVVWFAVGLAGGLIVVGLPRALSALPTSGMRTETPG